MTTAAKTCLECGIDKPLEAFCLVRNRNFSPRRRSRCRPCEVIARRKHRASARALIPAPEKADTPKLPGAKNLSERDWSGAHCTGLLDAMYPAPNSKTEVAYAKRVCEGCPVKAECLEYGLEQDDHYRWGIWGGLTGTERARLRRKT